MIVRKMCRVLACHTFLPLGKLSPLTTFTALCSVMDLLFAGGGYSSLLNPKSSFNSSGLNNI